MYLHFSDWSMFMELLNRKGIPHGDKIIKIYASDRDPREVLGNPKLFVLQINDTPFKEDDLFTYKDRESYTGPALEIELNETGLSETGSRHARALFRFSNSPEIQSCQLMMSIKKPDGSWMFSHPFDDIDGINTTLRSPEWRNNSLHVDIFSKQSLARLKQVVDFDQQELLVPYGREMMKLIFPERAGMQEGIPNKLEF